MVLVSKDACSGPECASREAISVNLHVCPTSSSSHLSRDVLDLAQRPHEPMSVCSYANSGASPEDVARPDGGPPPRPRRWDMSGDLPLDELCSGALGAGSVVGEESLRRSF